MVALMKNPLALPSTKSWLPLSWAVVAMATFLPPVANAYVAQLMAPLKTAAPSTPRATANSMIEAKISMFVANQLAPPKGDKSLLLWSVYPASVRGRSFGAKGGIPSMSDDSRMGSGGGW